MADASSTELLYRLVCEFALDPRGNPDGLTPAEMRRAWQARHRAPLPRGALSQLSDTGMVYRYFKRRTCVVTGDYRMPWVPSTMQVLSSCN
jgi:hypothetical protein